MPAWGRGLRETPADAPLALEVTGLKKSYGRTEALVSVSLQGREGSVHALIGENGTGKSTLVKVLSGVVTPDAGEVLAFGRPMARFTPQEAARAGIVAVFQEVLIAPNLSVLDNLFLGVDGLLRRRESVRQRRELARAVWTRISRAPVDLDETVGRLPLAQRQLVVIARALVRDPSILILDEATAALDMDSRDTLFEEIRTFVRDRRLVIFITHRLDEVEAIADEVTVLRAGRSVGTVPRQAFDPEAVLRMMSPETVSGPWDGGERHVASP